MSSSVQVPCPGCRVPLRVPADQPGKKVRCPKCKTVFAPLDEAVPVAELVPDVSPARPAPLTKPGPPVIPIAPPKPAPKPPPEDDDVPYGLDSAPPAPKPEAQSGVGTGIVGAPKRRTPARPKPAAREDEEREEPEPWGMKPVVIAAAVLLLAAIGVVVYAYRPTD
jgi:LSD1 subclass zinc finger protein